MATQKATIVATAILQDFAGNELMTTTTDLAEFLEEKFTFKKAGQITGPHELAELIITGFHGNNNATVEGLAEFLDKTLLLNPLGPFNGLGAPK